jgi:hypothetical protein
VETSTRVYVKTPLFEGWATVVAYFPNEAFYPLQVELDVGDAEGHRLKRVCKDDICKSEILRTDIPKDVPQTDG